MPGNGLDVAVAGFRAGRDDAEGHQLAGFGRRCGSRELTQSEQDAVELLRERGSGLPAAVRVPLDGGGVAVLLDRPEEILTLFHRKNQEK